MLTLKEDLPRKTMQITDKYKTSTNERVSKSQELHVDINNLNDSDVKTCTGFKSKNLLLTYIVITYMMEIRKIKH